MSKAMIEPRRVIWSNAELDFERDWRDDLSAQYPDYTEDELLSLMYDLNNGSMQVSGIHPYDETEYHWANKPAADANWQIIRNGKRCACLPSSLSVLQVIDELLKADKAANLKPIKAIW